jgi:hypothetical protein
MGFFSWKCAKSGKSISNSYSIKGATPCVMVTPDRIFVEEDYEGYGLFCGIDAYAWLAYANGLIPGAESIGEIMANDRLLEEARNKGIKLAFSDEKPADYKPIKIVALDEYKGEPYWSLPASEDCEYQGYFYP